MLWFLTLEVPKAVFVKKVGVDKYEGAAERRKKEGRKRGRKGGKKGRRKEEREEWRKEGNRPICFYIVSLIPFFFAILYAVGKLALA